MRDYSQVGDPYAISEYTAQSADGDVNGVVWKKAGGDRDVRGCALLLSRSAPTQAEADAVKGYFITGPKVAHPRNPTSSQRTR